MLDRKSEDKFFFTEQFNSGSKLKFFPQKTKKPAYTAIDKANQIRGWLDDVGNDIMSNDKGRYNNIYKIAKEACLKHNNEAEIARYEMEDPQPLFALPTNLSTRDIARELEKGVIEITMEDDENPFYGCRLKLKPFYISSCMESKDVISPAVFMIPSLVPLSLPVSASEVSLLGGFKIYLDASPEPASKCSIS